MFFLEKHSALLLLSVEQIFVYIIQLLQRTIQSLTFTKVGFHKISETFTWLMSEGIRLHVMVANLHALQSCLNAQRYKLVFLPFDKR